MANSPAKVFNAVVIASGASTSSGLNLTKVYDQLSVKVGTMSTAMATKIQASVDGGTTYQDVFSMTNSSATQVNGLIIGSTAGVNGGLVPVPYGALPFNNIRFVLTGVVSGGVSFTVVCAE